MGGCTGGACAHACAAGQQGRGAGCLAGAACRLPPPRGPASLLAHPAPPWPPSLPFPPNNNNRWCPAAWSLGAPGSSASATSASTPRWLRAAASTRTHTTWTVRREAHHAESWERGGAAPSTGQAAGHHAGTGTQAAVARAPVAAPPPCPALVAAPTPAPPRLLCLQGKEPPHCLPASAPLGLICLPTLCAPPFPCPHQQASLCASSRS